MRTHLPDQHLPINGWEDNFEDSPILQLCPRPYLFVPSQQPTRQSSASQQKLPLNDHRRSTTKPMLRKYINQQSIKLNKRVLQNYLTRQSEKSSNYLEQLDSKSHCQIKMRQKDRPDLKDIFLSLKENQDKSQMIKNDLFNCPMIEKKHRRKIHAKSKVFQQLPKSCLGGSHHRTGYSSKFQSTIFDLEIKFIPNKRQAVNRQLYFPFKSYEKKKNNKFPIFFREMTDNDNNSSEQVRRLNINRNRVKNKTQFHPSNQTIKVYHPLNSQSQFTDDNIFPAKRLIRG